MYDLTEFQEQMRQRRPVPWDQLPDFPLYMDQVLTLFDRTLSESKRAPGDKLLTKTMVNNYVKEGLITLPRSRYMERYFGCSFFTTFFLREKESGGKKSAHKRGRR